MKFIHLLLFSLFLISTSGAFMSFNTSENPAVPGGKVVKDKDGKILRVNYIRNNAHQDDDNMKILADALKKMKEMDCDDPMSWYMQGAIHGAPYTSNIFCDEASFQKAVNDAWHNCTHDYDTLGLSWYGARLHFFSWHRMYLNHFEEIIREVSGKTEFSLPYWKYDDPDFHTLPTLLKDTSSSLYEAHRNKHMNNGGKIEVGSFACIDDFTDPHNAFEASGFHFFTKHLENVPHNKIHVYLGQNPTNKDDQIDPVEAAKDTTKWGYMAQLYSPMDPVFWVHHANIDRLYEQFFMERMGDKLDNDGRPTKEDFTEHPWFYRFFEAGKKELTHYKDLGKVYDMMYGVQSFAYDLYLEDGQYDKKYEDEVYNAIQSGKWNESKFKSIDLLVASHESDVRAGGAAPPQFTLQLNADVPDLKKTKREIWVLKIDVKFKKEPKEAFCVYIKDKNKDTQMTRKALAGVMTFFGTGHDHHSNDRNLHDHIDHQFGEAHFEFDITNEINFSNFSGDMEFEVLPSDPREKITIDEIQLVKQVVVKSK